MHKLITGYPMTDHEDRNPQNNQRYNLRSATKRQNTWNSSKNSAAFTSTYKGVCWQEHAHKWRVLIRNGSKQLHVGYFATEIEAALAYDQAAIKYHGEYACTNAMLGLLPSQTDRVLAA